MHDTTLTNDPMLIFIHDSAYKVYIHVPDSGYGLRAYGLLKYIEFGRKSALVFHDSIDFIQPSITFKTIASKSNHSDSLIVLLENFNFSTRSTVFTVFRHNDTLNIYDHPPGKISKWGYKIPKGRYDSLFVKTEVMETDEKRFLLISEKMNLSRYNGDTLKLQFAGKYHTQKGYPDFYYLKNDTAVINGNKMEFNPVSRFKKVSASRVRNELKSK